MFRATRWDRALSDQWAKQREDEQRERDRIEQGRKQAPNPFASTSAFANPFSAGLGDAIFGSGSLMAPSDDAPSVTDGPLASDPADSAEWDADALIKLPAYYLATTYEPSPEPAPSLASQVDALSINDEDRHRPGKGKGRRREAESITEPGWSNEAYEVQKLPGYSPEFERFTLRVNRPGAQGQCVRYERGGQPLRYGPEKLATVSSCEACGSARSYEMCVMPQALSYIDKDHSDDLEIGWATLHVYSCERDCTEADGRGEVWREEMAVLEFDG